MTPVRLLIDVWLAIVVLSLLSVAAISIAWMWLGLATVAGARGRRLKAARRAAPGDLAGCDLADIDDALERILAEEHATMTRPASQTAGR